MDKQKVNTERLEALVQALSGCTDQEICAAISMLPDYAGNGLMIVMAAAARVIAEHFQNSDTALVEFAKLVNRMKEEAQDEN